VLNLVTDDHLFEMRQARETLSDIWKQDISSILSSYWNEQNNNLTVFSCSAEGVIQGSLMDGSSFSSSFSLHHPLGHVDIVRDVVQLDLGLIASGGEDSKICIWSS
jgi:hypothetical protein